MKISHLLLWQLSVLPFAASACDICGCYTPPLEAASQQDRRNYASVSEQFTRFGSIRVDGDELDDPSGQYLNSSITQFILGRSFWENHFYLQANIPLIYRDYKRPEGFRNEHGTESGLGDISLLARYRVLEHQSAVPSAAATPTDGKSLPETPTAYQPGAVLENELAFSFHLLAGIKLPTGDSSRIKEEFNEIEVEGAPESGIHGHDLTLGNGSYDAILGGEFLLRDRALFFQAETRFTLRGDGHYSYHFANDLTWSGGPGWYLVQKAESSCTLQAVLSGETKDTDRFQGREAEDTGITALYVGPQITVSRKSLSAELGLDLPVLLNNTSLQVVPDYRIRAAITLHF